MGGFPKPHSCWKVRGVRRTQRAWVPGANNSLSEYAHPNARGTTGLYSTIDRENILVDFGLQDRNTKPAKAICVANLSVTLMLFERTYNDLSELIPAFVKLCESEIPPL